MRHTAFVPVALTIIVAACAPAAAPAAGPEAGTTNAPPPTVAASDTPAATATAVPSSTPTVSPSATPTPQDLSIAPSTLAQLRVRWSVSNPGKGSFLTYSTCYSTTCDMLTRIGGYAFSPDSALLAVGVCTGDPTENKSGSGGYRYTCKAPGEVRLYQTATGELKATLAVGGFPISLAFDPQGKILAMGMADRQIEIWDLPSMQRIHQLQHSSTHSGVTAMAFTPDDSLLVSLGDGKLQVWDWQKAVMLKSLSGWAGISFDPSGSHLATVWYSQSSASPMVRVYDLTNLGQFREIRPRFVQPNMFDNTVTAMFTRDGSRIVITAANGAEWWDVQGKAMQGKTDMTKLLSDKSTSFMPGIPATPDGLVLAEPLIASLSSPMPGFSLPNLGAAGEGPCGFALWNPQTPGYYAYQPPAGTCEDPINFGDGQRATISPDGDWIAADDGGGQLRIWGVDPAAPASDPVCIGTCGG